MRIIPNKIKPILLGSMLLIGIVPAALYNSISSDKLATVATEQIAEGLRHRTELAAHSLDGVLEQRMLSIHKLANSPVFQLAHAQALSQGNFMPDYLRELVKTDPGFSRIDVIEYQQGALQPIASSVPFNLRSFNYYLAQDSLTPLLDDLPSLISGKRDVLFTPPQFANNKAFVYVISPVAHAHQADDTRERFLLIKYQLDELNSQLTFLGERISDTDYVMLINPQGDVVLSGRHQGQQLNAFTDFSRFYTQNPELITQKPEKETFVFTPEGELVPATDTTPNRSPLLSYTNRHGAVMVATLAPLTFEQVGFPQWTLVSVTQKNAVTATLDYLQQWFLTALFFTAGIVIILSLILTRHITEPLANLSRFAAQFKLGNYARNKSFRGPQEFQMLHDALNQGADKISDDTQQLNLALHKAKSADRAKSTFLANLSHEIRTPMNGMLGLAQLLLKTDLTREQDQHLRTLLDSGKHMMSLLNDILDFSKIEQGQLVLDPTHFCFTDLLGTIESTYHSLAREKGIGFQIHCDFDQRRWFFADKARIRQVLFNLLSNAIKFTEKGRVDITLNLDDTTETSPRLTIIVKDSGIGIPKNRITQIFDPFAQAEVSTSRRFGGTGLGLSIVKQLIDLMKGDISVTSLETIGSTFTVILPLTPGHYIADDYEDIDFDSRDFAHLNVLIVEDNPLNVLIIDSFLKQRQFVTTVANNGAEALEIMAQQDFDLILMDNHMPVMDGIETIGRIRKLSAPTCNTPIFACTADVFAETQRKMLDAGAQCVITKPLDERKLVDALQRFKHKITAMSHASALAHKGKQPATRTIAETTPPLGAPITALVKAPRPVALASCQATASATVAMSVSADDGITPDSDAHSGPDSDPRSDAISGAGNPKAMLPAHFETLNIDALLDLMDNDHEIVTEFLHMFCQEHSQDGQRFVQALAVPDFDLAILISHSLKGAAGSISAHTLAAAAQVVEKQVKQQQAPSHTEVEALNLALNALVEEIQHKLNP
ncbi:ATP-binding protein [Photobacterium japonica]|uniref:hybrid sensor histidine kinase/response regulator n=1 Tax=Photobacterium japonica TaxID=2910235 RepID=UPI003D0EF894